MLQGLRTYRIYFIERGKFRLNWLLRNGQKKFIVILRTRTKNKQKKYRCKIILIIGQKIDSNTLFWLSNHMNFFLNFRCYEATRQERRTAKGLKKLKISKLGAKS